jgi:ABC-2 type transport system ATP-binding protein
MVQSAVNDSTRSVIDVNDLRKTYGRKPPVYAVRDVSFSVDEGEIVGLLGPDGAGKTSIIQMIAGVATPDHGSVRVQGTDVSDDPETVKKNIGYMPQGLGQNLYDRLSVRENIEFFRDLRDLPVKQVNNNIERLLDVTRLTPFLDREAGNLSGGMRQKLALICTLLHFPDVLLLDEPTTGVDPISRQDFWKVMHDLIQTGDVTILLSTSYMGEAERCHHVLFMHNGSIIESGTPDQLRDELTSHYIHIETEALSDLIDLLRNEPDTVHIRVTGGYMTLETRQSPDRVRHKIEEHGLTLHEFRPYDPGLDEVFIDRLEERKTGSDLEMREPMMERNLEKQTLLKTDEVTRTFDGFTAVDKVSMQIERGEVFGLLGPNGAGKTTLIKMMVGLLEPSNGSLRVLGEEMHYQKKSIQKRIGYMAQNFSLYEDLSIRENLELFAGLYDVPAGDVDRMVERLGLEHYIEHLAGEPPVGIRQRVGLACSLLHEPPLLFLDEPTSGVDPLARRTFWNLIYDLSRTGETTVLITTHYMAEADMCDRLALMNNGRIVAGDSPSALKQQAESRSGRVLSIRCDNFRRAFSVLESEYPSATLFGDRIHIRTDRLKADTDRVRNLLNQNGIRVDHLEPTELTMQEAFVDFLENDHA